MKQNGGLEQDVADNIFRQIWELQSVWPFFGLQLSFKRFTDVILAQIASCV